MNENTKSLHDRFDKSEKSDKLTNMMIFNILTDLVGDIAHKETVINTPQHISNPPNPPNQPVPIQLQYKPQINTGKSKYDNNTEINELLAAAKEGEISLENINHMKFKLLEYHALLNNSSFDKIMSILNSLDLKILKNKVTIGVLLSVMEHEIRQSVSSKFNSLKKLTEINEKYTNKKNSKNTDLFLSAVRERYKLREIVIYTLFPMIYTAFSKSGKTDFKDLEKLYSIASSNGFNEKNLNKKKKELSENIGFGSSIKSLKDKIDDRDILYKIGTSIDLYEQEEIEYINTYEDVAMGLPLNLSKGQMDNIKNKVMTEATKKGKSFTSSKSILNSIGAHFKSNLDKMDIENSKKEELDKLFEFIEKNSEVFIILEMLDILRGNLLSK